MHPKERRGLNRRQLLKGAAGVAAGAGGLGALAGCANTTTPIESGGAGGAGGSALAQLLVAARPLGPGGLPLPRNDYSVTWNITEDNPPVADGTQPEGGTLDIFNYADYLDPDTIAKFEGELGVKVTVATYNSVDEAIAKLISGAVSFDIIAGFSSSTILQQMAGRLMQPLNHTLLPNLSANIWGGLQDPYYDRGSRYTVPYVVWSEGIGWRNDLVEEDIPNLPNPWDIFWEGGAYKGKVGLLDDSRSGPGMPLQRLSISSGRTVDLNTEDPALLARAGAELAQLTDLLNIKVAITDYQTLPEATTVLHHSWSGDLLSAAIYYLPEGTEPTVLSFWMPDAGGVVQNDFFWIPRSSKRPALAHAFMNFMLDTQNAYDNFVNFVGYTPPQNTIDARKLIDDGLIPESLSQAVIRPEQFNTGQQYAPLSVEGDRLWQDTWSKFRAG